MIDIIAFDADDTLWHNETLYRGTEKRFQQLLAGYQPEEQTEQALFQTEMRNLPLYGYGIKSFALSMIETAIEVSQARIAAGQIQEIIGLVKAMLEARVELLDHVADVIPLLAQRCTLMLVTKGDLRDQEAKLAGSGLAQHFDHVEIVRDKNVDVYRSLLARNNVAPQRFLMVGNSLRSDVLPVVELGGHAVHIPYQITWAHEVVQGAHGAQGGYVELAHIGMLPGHVEGLCHPAR